MACSLHTAVLLFWAAISSPSARCCFPSLCSDRVLSLQVSSRVCAALSSSLFPIGSTQYVSMELYFCSSRMYRVIHPFWCPHSRQCLVSPFVRFVFWLQRFVVFCSLSSGVVILRGLLRGSILLCKFGRSTLDTCPITGRCPSCYMLITRLTVSCTEWLRVNLVADVIGCRSVEDQTIRELSALRLRFSGPCSSWPDRSMFCILWPCSCGPDRVMFRSCGASGDSKPFRDRHCSDPYGYWYRQPTVGRDLQRQQSCFSTVR